uniref:LysM domain-containing protein n=1 Tax=Oryzias latipes TaxID=8090 RepID=A0A3P9JWT3_ORYLA
MQKKRPPGTVEYTVGPNDSLNSIALKFNITPNKLVQLNKLFSPSVFPGQVRVSALCLHVAPLVWNRLTAGSLPCFRNSLSQISADQNLTPSLPLPLTPRLLTAFLTRYPM